MEVIVFRLAIITTLVAILTISPCVSRAEISVHPIGFAVGMGEGETVSQTLFVANVGNEDIVFEIKFDSPEENRDFGERRLRDVNGSGAGPRRDPPPEGAFAIFQDQQAWGFYDAWFPQRMEDINYRSYRNAADLVNVELDAYDCIWVATGEQSAQFTTNWNENVDRFNEWVSNGGVIFVEQGWNGNHVNEGIGGLVDSRTPQEGVLARGLGRGGDQENWLVDQMGWQQNQQFPGGSTLHCVYPVDNLNRIEDCDFYQVIMSGAKTVNPASYGITTVEVM